MGIGKKHRPFGRDASRLKLCWLFILKEKTQNPAMCGVSGFMLKFLLFTRPQLLWPDSVPRDDTGRHLHLALRELLLRQDDVGHGESP